MQDEGRVLLNLHQLGQVVHRPAHVDERIAGVVEDPEAVVDPHVDARRLHHRSVIRVEDQAAGLDLLPDGAVAQDHNLCTCNGRSMGRSSLLTPAATR
jgi:hypothetical protein